MAAALAGAAVAVCVGVTAAGAPPAQAEDPAGGLDPAAGRIEISHDPAAQPAGWATTPLTEAQAAAAGYSRDESTVTDSGAYWNRWIEIVPVGGVPAADGLTYWVQDDGDFVAPGNVLNVPSEISEVKRPTSAATIPNFTFGDDAAANAAIPVTGGQIEVITSTEGVFRTTYRTFLTLNPSAALPSASEVYMAQSTKYSPQAGFRSIPQLRYITPVLARNAGLFEPLTEVDESSPNYARAYDSFHTAYTQLVSPDTDPSTPAQLDARLTVGQVRAAFDVLLHGGMLGAETVTAQADAAEDLPGGAAGGGEDPAPVMASWDTVERNRPAVIVNAIGYAQAHYTVDLPASDIEHLSLDTGEHTDRVTRALTRMLLAYTQASSQAQIVEPLAGITASSITARANDLGDKTIFDFRFQPSQARTVTFSAPTALRGKISFTSTAPELDRTHGRFELTATDTYTVTVSNDLNDYERRALAEVTFAPEEFTHSSLYHTFTPKSDYRQDHASGHWLVRQTVYVPSDSRAGDRASAPLAGTTTASPLISFQDATSTDKLLYTAALAIADPPELTTRVSANGHAAQLDGVDGAARSQALTLYPSQLTPAGTSDGNPAYVADLSDELRYRYLETDRDYLVWTRLMRLTQSGSRPTVDPAPVATAITTIHPTTMDGLSTASIDLGAVPVTAGETYVVYETVTAEANVSNLTQALAGTEDPQFTSEQAVFRHEDPRDAAQTLRVLDPAVDTAVSVQYKDPSNTYRTQTVSAHAAGYDSTDDTAITLSRELLEPGSRPGTALTVYPSDTVYYRGLEADQELTLSASLYRVVDGKPQGAPVATGTRRFTPYVPYGSSYGKQSVSLSRACLQAGATYVVYTRVLDAEGTVLASHEDPTALSQTIVVTSDPEPAVTVMELPHAGVDGWVITLLVGLPATALLAGMLVAGLRRRAS